MGKNWKKKDRITPDFPVDLSGDYKWSAQSYTLKEILNNFKLPVVVQCREETTAEHVKNFFFDLRQPVLLHSRCTTRKVFARCVRKAAGGTVKELLPEVVIPEDYAGWFKISRGLEFSKPAPHRTIESLTEAKSEFFLCTTEFDALLLPEVTEGADDDEEEELEEEAFHRRVQEGEVLRKTGVQKLNQMLLPATFQQAAPDHRYLMCIDMNDQELFIPVLQTGLFYEVSDGTFDQNDNGVVQITDLLEEMVIFPLYVRHILGDPPAISKFYSPCLKLDRVKQEETVMGSTLESEEEDFLPIEVQTDSPIKFQIALNTPMLQNNVDYNDAVQLCNNIADNYVTDMKLAVTFKRVEEEHGDDESAETRVYSNPAFVGDENETGSVCNSQRTSIMSTVNGSEIGEVDANSEFNVQWDPGTNNTRLNRRQSSDLSTATDCASLESLGEEDVLRFNQVLGGSFVGVHSALTRQTRHSFSERYRSDTDVDGTLRAECNGDVILRTNEGVEITPFVDIVEGITDFSVRPALSHRELATRISPGTYKTGYPCITVPPSPFQRSSVRNSPTISSQSSQSKSSSPVSLSSCERSEINLSDHFPSVHSSSNESLVSVKKRNQSCSSNVSSSSETHLVSQHPKSNKEYTFTGDVFINHSSEDELHTISSENKGNRTPASKDWGDKYRVIRSRDMKRGREAFLEKDVGLSKDKFRHSSLTDELLRFTHEDTHMAPDGIITCKVADEMMSSYNDLRISLEEVTRTARAEHVENTWRAFCLERSSSLPVRTKSSTEKPVVNPEDYSQSWEQISPRRTDDSTTTSASGSSKRRDNTPRALNKSKTKVETKPLDKTLLLIDTSSEDSFQLSYKSDTSIGSANNSFTLSEMSDNDVNANVLPGLKEVNFKNDTISVDGTVQNGNTLTRDKHALSKKMKVKREIKRKKIAEWNGDVSEI